MNLLTLPIGTKAPEIVNAVVEVPYGCTNKYEYDKTLQLFRLDRPLYASVHYPGEYGFIPSTLSADGDALDIIILVYIQQASHPAQIRHLVDRAVRIAKAERTVTCIIIPADLQEEKAVKQPEHLHGPVHSGYC